VSDSIPVNYHILELKASNQLSVKAVNVCTKNELYSLYDLIEHFLQHSGFKDLRGCGAKINNEITAFVVEYAEALKNHDDPIFQSKEYSDYVKFKNLCYEHLEIGAGLMQKFMPAYLAKEFTLFAFIIFALEYKLSERNYFILKNNLGYFYKGKNLSLHATGVLYGKSRERIRQIVLRLPYQVREMFLPLAGIAGLIENYINYPLKKQKDFILIDEDFAGQVNRAENLDCTQRFFAVVFSVLLNDTHYYFQEPFSESRNYFLIRRKLGGQFDFMEFYYDLRDKTSAKVPKDYSLDFRHYVRTFYRPGKFSYFEQIVDVCKQIANAEFPVSFNLDDEMIVRRNKRIIGPEMAEMILEEAGRPLHLKEIAKQFRKRNFKTSDKLEVLRSVVLASQNISAIGKSSTYALKTWTHIETGTVRQVVEKYLKANEYPMHINDLTKILNKSRSTTVKNVLTNLKIDQSGRFVFFNDGFVGLRSKQYAATGTTNGQLRLL
jgi:hypothetical protein